MPETPDFDQIARQLALNHAAELQNIDGFDNLTHIVEAAERLRLDLAAQLRLVWNARGAADRALLTKYMAHVFDREGVTFIDGDRPPQFTAEEWVMLQQIDRDVDATDRAARKVDR